jgi:hypothetical protein
MGCFDIFCIICGCPYYVLYDNETLFTEEKYKKITSWMNKAVLLTASGETITNAKEVECSMVFMTPNKIKYESVTRYTPILYITYSFFVHKDCYEYVYNITGKKIRYDMFNAKKGGDKQIDIEYGIIEKYWSQDFQFEKAIKDKNEYIFNSPLKNNKKNNNRINKNIKQFRLKKNRKGPEISASLCNENDIRIGNDGLFWIKKENKWIKLNIEQKKYTIKYLKKYDNILRKMSQIYESSKKMIFYKLMPQKNILEFIGDEKNIEMIKIMIK